MYERFTDRARKVMQLANQEAQRFNHEYIGTEHLLLGLVKLGGGVAATAIKNREVDLRTIRLEVEKLIQSGPEMITMGKLPQTPRAKKTIEYAMEEARNLGHSFVGTEHLILGLMRVKEGVAHNVLTKLGLDLENLRDEVCKLLGTGVERDEMYGGRKQKSKTPALDSFTDDITELARENKLTPVIGRQKEIDQLATVLSRRDCRNAILIGDSGSGRRSIIHGLAQQIVEKTVRNSIVDHRVVLLDQALLVAGTKYRGQFEERVKAMVNEMRRAKNVVLFVPQIYSLARLGLDEETGLSALEMLKFAMLQNQIHCVGTCTSSEYEEFLSADSDLHRFFQRIPVNPLTKEETLEILIGIKKVYETYHNVEIRREALKAAVELSEIYLPHRVMPVTAIGLIDEACARLGLEIGPPDVYEIKCHIKSKVHQIEDAIASRDFDEAAKLRDEIHVLKKELEAELKKWKSEPGSTGVVGIENVIAALSLESGVPEQDIADGNNAPKRDK